jgi:NADPH:quinone reductase-like Zn-dependent oxidoreductase
MVENIVKGINEGKLRSHLHARLKLNRAGLEEAHKRIESGATIGKIGLGIDEEGAGDPFT